MYNSQKISAFAQLSENPALVAPRQPSVARLVRSLADACRRTFEAWRESARFRAELSQMSARDFGDLPVSPVLLREEARRWPWQSASRGWNAIRDDGRRTGRQPLFRDSAR
jgi:uncharacterized protein YjiS (DUF1127 family)